MTLLLNTSFWIDFTRTRSPPPPLKQFIAPFVLDPQAHLAAPVRELVLARDSTGLPSGDPGHWIERNRRVLQRYQALVRSAITLDALADQEVNGSSIETQENREPLRSG